jgi:hypothetical protein
MGIVVNWRKLRGPKDAGWRLTRVLYAYAHPDESRVLYIGKAHGAYSTVRTRWQAVDKDEHWEFSERHLGLPRERVLVLVGDLETERSLTRELLADVESLLIKRLGPPMNISATKSRTSRPGMTVRCGGPSWPHPERVFFKDR